MGRHRGQVRSRVWGRDRHRAFDATAWLSEHGAEYGPCQTYSNESWHYEVRPRAVGRGCPPMYADSTRGSEDEQ